ncbi:MAG TPA: CHASE3 domain-containing protein [Steroidobacteraceae bacterium]|jgi:signal transduction histidine kinase|nr:CHASE3 domain-containing protein [Steroidobacteraceae bacterium]
MTSPSFLNARSVYVPVAITIALLIALLVVAEAGQARLRNATSAITQSQWRQAALAEFLRSLGEAESAQRGFLLTEKSRYLTTYDPAIRRLTSILDRLNETYARGMNDNDATGSAKAFDESRRLRLLVGIKIGEMNSTLRLYGESGRYAAIALIDTDMGNKTSTEVRDVVYRLRDIETRTLNERLAIWQKDVLNGRLLIGTGTLLNIVLVLAAGILLARDLRYRERFSADLASRNEELDRQVQERTRSLSALSSHLQEVSETEKAALARELHDELGGLLIATKMDIVWLRRKLDNGDPALTERWERVLRSLEEGVDFKRRVIENLRPTLLDNLGLVPALRWLSDETCRRAGLGCNDSYPDDLADLSPEVNIALFRVAQECLTNILKHARASEVTLDLVADASAVHLTIRDNGVGIAPERIGVSQSHGLASMNHRVTALGGKLSIGRAAVGRGTVIEVSLPLGQPEAAAA